MAIVLIAGIAGWALVQAVESSLGAAAAEWIRFTESAVIGVALLGSFIRLRSKGYSLVILLVLGAYLVLDALLVLRRIIG